MEVTTFFYFLTASVLLTLAPGPDNLYLLTKSLSAGAKSGVTFSSGLASGIFFHTFLVMVGVAAVIKNSEIALTLLKIFGAAYLLFLAFKSFQAGRAGGEIAIKKSDGKSNLIGLYRRGVLMNVLNPKVLLFFLAFLPQFVNLSDESAALQIAFLGLTFAVQAFLIFSGIAIFAGHVRKFILRKKNIGKIFNYIEAGVLGFIALTLIVL